MNTYPRPLDILLTVISVLIPSAAVYAIGMLHLGIW